MSKKFSIFPEPPLYALTDRGLAGGRDHEEIVADLLEGGARIIQIREKILHKRYQGGFQEGHLPSGATETAEGEIESISREKLRSSVLKCLNLTRSQGALLIVNDDPALAAEVGADGAHIGQDDIAPEHAREILGRNRLLGVSTHSRAQFWEALKAPIDYVAVGPVFATTSKCSPYQPLGLDFAAWAAKEASRRRIPCVPIGGIDSNRIEALMNAAPDCCPAVISALMSSDKIASATHTMIGRIRAAIDS